MFDQIMRELSALPAMSPGGAVPLTLPPPMRSAPNVFEIPRAPSDPPLPWAAAGRGPRARRRSILPWLTAAMILGIGIGMWRDRPARTRTVSSLLAAGQHATTFLHR